MCAVIYINLCHMHGVHQLPLVKQRLLYCVCVSDPSCMLCVFIFAVCMFCTLSMCMSVSLFLCVCHICTHVCLLCVHFDVQIAFNHHHHIQPPPPHATNTTTYTTSTTTTCCCHHHMQQPIPHIQLPLPQCHATTTITC